MRKEEKHPNTRRDAGGWTRRSAKLNTINNARLTQLTDMEQPDSYPLHRTRLAPHARYKSEPVPEYGIASKGKRWIKTSI